MSWAEEQGLEEPEVRFEAYLYYGNRQEALGVIQGLIERDEWDQAKVFWTRFLKKFYGDTPQHLGTDLYLDRAIRQVATQLALKGLVDKLQKLWNRYGKS